MRYNFDLMEEKRKAKRMEYVELAARVGLSESHIRQILSGYSGCTEKTMWKICDALELNPKKLEKQHNNKR